MSRYSERMSVLLKNADEQADDILSEIDQRVGDIVGDLQSIIELEDWERVERVYKDLRDLWEAI